MKITKRVSIFFAWYDFWSGIYWDRNKHILYIIIIPMFPIKIDFAKKSNNRGRNK